MVLGHPGRVDPDFIRAELMKLHYLNNLLVLDSLNCLTLSLPFMTLVNVLKF